MLPCDINVVSDLEDESCSETDISDDGCFDDELAIAVSPPELIQSTELTLCPDDPIPADTAGDFPHVDAGGLTPRARGPSPSCGSTRESLPGTDETGDCGNHLMKTLQGKRRKSTPSPSGENHGSAKGHSWPDAERRDLEFVACFGKAQSVNAVPVVEHEGWRQVGITIDSGAAMSVADPSCFPGYAVDKHPKPIWYQSATGEPTKNVGNHDIALLTREGSLRGIRFQATDRVKKPLAAVKSIVEAGHAVVFAPPELSGSFILNMNTLEENQLREDDGNYILDTWIPPPGAVGFHGTLNRG